MQLNQSIIHIFQDYYIACLIGIPQNNNLAVFFNIAQKGAGGRGQTQQTCRIRKGPMKLFDP